MVAVGFWIFFGLAAGYGCGVLHTIWHLDRTGRLKNNDK